MANRFWVGGGATANWNEAAGGVTNWGTLSNTRDHAAVPGSSDDVFFDGVGFGNTPSTLSAAITVKSATFTGYANTLTHNAAITLTVAAGGAVVLASGMTYTLGAATSAISIGAAGTLTTNGRSIGNLLGSLTFLDNCTSIGTFNPGTTTANGNGKNHSFTAVVGGSPGGTLTLGSGTWTLTGTGSVWAFARTLVATGSTILVTDASTTAKTFAGGGKTFNNLTVTGDNVALTGANTFATLANNSRSTTGLILPSATTTTATGFTSQGQAKLSASTPGSAATLSIASGTIEVKGMTIQDSTVTGGATFNARGSVNVSGNTGWNFYGWGGFFACT